MAGWMGKEEALPGWLWERNRRLPAAIRDPEVGQQWRARMRNPDGPIVLDMFCGAGGFSIGFAAAGFVIGAGIDNDASAAMTYGHNLAGLGVCDDVRSIANPERWIADRGIPRVDVCIASPPCQGFSRVGKAKIRSLGREAFYREHINTLIDEVIRFIEALQPMAFLIENVPDLRLEYDPVTMLRERLPAYGIDARILDASWYGVPQRRLRLFIQGMREPRRIQWPSIPFAPRVRTLEEAIGDLPDPIPMSVIPPIVPYTERETLSSYARAMRNPDGATTVLKHMLIDHVVRSIHPRDAAMFAMLQPGETSRDLAPDHYTGRRDAFGDRYRRLRYDHPAPTITAHLAKDGLSFIHPTALRPLTLREAARAQSFSDHFMFGGPLTHRLRMIGNAVPPLLARALADALARSLT